MNRLRDKLSELHRDESGQSLVFGVISIFLVLIFGAMVLGVGRVTARRIQIQFAADSAAYSASVMESQCLNALAVLNTTMAKVRARTLRHVADVNMYGTLAEIRDKILNMNQDLDGDLQQRISNLRAALDQETDPEQQAQIQERINRLNEWRNSLREGSEEDGELLEVTDPAYWDQQISVLEQQITALEAELEEATGEREDELQAELDLLTEQLELAEERRDGLDPSTGQDPEWIQQIVGIDEAGREYAGDQAGDRDGAYPRAVRWVPAAEQWLEEMSRLEHTIAILAPYLSSETAYRVARKNGAEYTSIFPASRWLPHDDARLDLDVYHNEAPNSWRIEGGDTYLEVSEASCGGDSNCASCGDPQMCWEVEWGRGLSQQSRYLICEMEDRTWYLRDMIRETDICIQQREETYITTWGPEGVEVVRHGADEGYDPPILELINEDGENWPDNVLFVRRVQVEGGEIIEQAEYQWDEQAGEWVLPEEEDFEPLGPSRVNIDGVNISVTLDPVLPLPGQAEIRRLIPPSVALLTPSGERWGRVDLREGNTEINANINGVHVEVLNNAARMVMRGERLSTRTTRGNWHTHFDRREFYWWQHRLIPQGPPAGWEQSWHYTYEEFGTRLTPETNGARLVGIAAAEPQSARMMGYPEAVITGGRLRDDAAENVDLPHWAYFQGEDGPGNPAGWLNVMTGNLVAGGQDGQGNPIPVYHQQRECWYPLCRDGSLGEDYDGDGVIDVCPVCEGEGEVTMGPADLVEHNRLGRRTLDDPQPSDRERHFVEADLGGDRVPLVLTEDFFAYGLSVGAWHRRETHFPEDRASDAPERPVEYMLHDPYPGMKGLVHGPRDQSAQERGESLRPQWGYFALAAARTRLRNVEAEGPAPELLHGAYFRDVAVRQEWLSDSMNNLYIRGSQGDWSYWDARLFPLSEQVLDEDIIQGLEGGGETGTGWLMRRIAHGSPGGLIWSRQGRLPPTYYGYGDVTGWTQDIYGQYDNTYPPRAVQNDLTGELRPRRRYPGFGPAYDSMQGVRRDPFMEYLGTRPQDQRQTGGQLDYNALERDDVLH